MRNVRPIALVRCENFPISTRFASTVKSVLIRRGPFLAAKTSNASYLSRKIRIPADTATRALWSATTLFLLLSLNYLSMWKIDAARLNETKALGTQPPISYVTDLGLLFRHVSYVSSAPISTSRTTFDKSFPSPLEYGA